MKVKLLLFSIILTVISCKPTKDKRVVFDSKGQKAITSSVSKKLRTVSILFGNQAALESALKGGAHRGGEMFTFVTWNQDNEKFWFPGLINGKIKSIEVVNIVLRGNTLKPDYRLVQGTAPKRLTDQLYTQSERIEFITSQRPSIYP
ncbi:hypothetical protein [Pedobacter jamesrossensis]|uniref:Uncharacterized protein n=1 Tax=Pedobacter jamesrossensis TaxID=1908238 RepID=A0ABV8NN83_9SPHI